jgi:asparagine synthase (glutamine-hydrolysing)
MYRYLAFIWDPSNPDADRVVQNARATLKTNSSQWVSALDVPGLLVVHSAVRSGVDQAHALTAKRGVVLGTLFKKGEPESVAHRAVSFDEQATDRVIRSSGRELVDQYWGRYVAFVRDVSAGVTHVIREPLASLTCYHMACSGAEILFSHIEDCHSLLGMRFSVNLPYVAGWLRSHLNPVRACGLVGVSDVPGGERWTFSPRGRQQQFIWSPAAICRSYQYEDAQEAGAVLRSSVESTVSAWAACYPRIVHGLSGGLDSSIVAACLARAPAKPVVSCLNIYLELSSDEVVHLPGLSKRAAARVRAIIGNGDERQFARLVAAKWGFDLREEPRSISHLKPSALRNAPLAVSPSVYAGSMEIDDVQIRAVQEHGAGALFSGLAGDSVFYVAVRPIAAIDYVYNHGLGPQTLEHMRAAANMSKQSIWSVGYQALKHGILRRPMSARALQLSESTLLKDEVVSGLRPSAFEHPWCEDLNGLPPGKSGHIHGVASSCFYEHELHRQHYATSINPLHSQPVWEVALRIPSYVHLLNGASRGLARRAFADVLPDEVRVRQSKGSGGAFVQALVKANMAVLRESLLDGALVAAGLLDRKKAQAYLVDDQRFATIPSWQILNYFAAEIWLQQWSAARLRAVA